jgi:hypothetical protein
MPWKRGVVYALCASIALAGLAVWFINATVFCMADSGIYTSQIPGGPFHKGTWKDVRQITVDCGYGRSGTDVSYILTMKDGSRLDIADAWPMPGPVWPADSAYDQFKKNLDGVPFQFAPNIRPTCPKNLVAWVSKKP